MKKLLAFFIASIMALTAAGCAPAVSNSNAPANAATADAGTKATADTGNQATADAGAQAAVSETAAAAPAATENLKPYVIDYYMLANSVSSEVGPVSEAINKIIQPKFNATVNITMLTWGDWFTKTQAALAAGDKIDILFTADWYQYMNSIANNNLMPLNDLIDQYGAEMKAQLGETFIKGSQYKNINYGVPTDKELAVNGGFVWNKTLADKYNLKVDPTWKSVKDWEPLLKEIQAKEPNIVPFLFDGNMYHLNYINYLPCDLAFDASKPNDPTL